jgi:hypothetical protein
MKCYLVTASVLIATSASAQAIKYNPEFNAVVCDGGECAVIEKDPCTEASYRRWWQIHCMNGSAFDSACFRCSHIKSGIFTGSSDGTFGAFRAHQKLEEAKDYVAWAKHRVGAAWRELMPARMMKRLEAED